MVFRKFYKLFLLNKYTRLLLFVSIWFLFLYKIPISMINAPEPYKAAKRRVDKEIKWDFKHDKQYARLERLEIKKRFHRIPDEYFLNPKHSSKYNNSRSCGGYPWFSDLHFTNNYWQKLNTNGGTVQILSAAYDDRDTADPVVRIVTMINRNGFKETLACQLWYKSQNETVFSERVDVENIWFENKIPFSDRNYLTYLISCHIPDTAPKEAPESVSLVKNKCDFARNNVKVFDERPRDGEGKKNFGICVRAINFAFSNYAMLLVEWIELMAILGAEMITIYTYKTEERFQKVLDYYESIGRIEHYHINVPGQLDPFPSYIYTTEKRHESFRLETAALHECFYRNFQKFKYITAIDIDEAIVPTNNDTSWADMFETILMNETARNSTYFMFQQTHFITDWTLDDTVVADIPVYNSMLRHITRTHIRALNDSPKGFHDTRYTQTFYNHYVLNCTLRDCQIFNVSSSIGQVNHYREYFTNQSRKRMQEDKVVWKYKDELIHRTAVVLKKLELI